MRPGWVGVNGSGRAQSSDRRFRAVAQRSLLPAVRSHRLYRGENVSLHRLEQLFLARARGPIDLSVQRVELEELAVSSAGRTGATVAWLPPAVLAAPAAVREVGI